MSIAVPSLAARSARPTGGGSTYRQVAGLLAPRKALLLLIVALVVTSASLELVPPLILRSIVDEHLLVGQTDGLVLLAALFLVTMAAVEATRALAGYLTGVAAQGTLHDLRVRLFSHLQSLPIRWFDRTPLGEAIAHCTSDIEAIQTLFTSGVASVVIDLSRVVTISIALVALSPPLAGIAALTVPPLLILTRRLQVQVREAERQNRIAVGQQGAQLQETLVGAETIQTFGRQDAFIHRLRLTLAQTLVASNRATACSAMYSPNVAMIAAIAGAGLLWVGAQGGLASWEISLGTLTAFVLLLQRAFAPLAALGEQWQTVQGALAGVERVFDVLAVPSDRTGLDLPSLPWPMLGANIGYADIPSIPTAPQPEGALTPALSQRAREPDSPRPLGEGLGVRVLPPLRAGARGRGSEVTPAGELQDVVFGYAPGHPILHHVSLAIAPGEHVALVGRTGAGKSSALALLGGLYEPWEGRVAVLGQNPRELAPSDRRRLFGVVPQTALLFNGTVLENVTLFDPSVSREMAERVVSLAGAESFVAGLPHGYDTLLAGVGGGRGMRLSAGQTALLALARALVLDPPLILLDEATAAIDAATEAALATALRAGVVGRRRGLLTVAHRLATAREADRVIVLEGGRIVEEGPPGDLIRQGGRFAALVELEAAGWDWRDAPPDR
jgi:ATP-binding cassette subfamily B multidrug efflux pump